MGLNVSKTGVFAFPNRVLFCWQMSVLDGCDFEIWMIRAFVAGGK
jgi:hypothetical protein